MKNSKNNSNRTLSFQALEDRRLMTASSLLHKPLPVVLGEFHAPNVTTSISSKHVLTITGNNANDQISITQTAANEFTITGVNGTKINGTHTSENFKGITGDVDIKLAGDFSTTESVTIGDGKAISFPANLNVTLGNGTNTFDMTGATVKGAASVTGGSGQDLAIIQQSVIGTAPAGSVNSNDLNINLGGGNNELIIEDGVFVQRDLNVNETASAGDIIYIGNAANGQVFVGRNTFVDTGSGADDVVLSGLNMNGNLYVDTGDGSDTLYLGSVDPVSADNWYIKMGDGTGHHDDGDDRLVYGEGGHGGIVGTEGYNSYGSFDGGTGNNVLQNESGSFINGSVSNFSVE
jgi:hypothetical protein